MTIDAIPKKNFKGVVTEIGNNAIVRSTGLATTQISSRAHFAQSRANLLVLYRGFVQFVIGEWQQSRQPNDS